MEIIPSPGREATKQSNRLEAKTSKGTTLWIERDDRSDGTELWRLDCTQSYRGRHFDELPRFYRTPRGAKQGAALLTGERLAWALQEAANNAK